MSDTKKITVKARCWKCDTETNLTFIRTACKGAEFSTASIYNCDKCGCDVEGPSIFNNTEFNALTAKEKKKYHN